VNENDILLDHLLEVFKTGLPWDNNQDYSSIDRLKCFIHLNSTVPYYKLKGFDPKMFDNQIQTFKVVEMKSSIAKVMGIQGHVIPMVLEIYIVSEKSKFFDVFVNCNKILG